MSRFVRLFAVLSVFVVAFPAEARRHKHVTVLVAPGQVAVSAHEGTGTVVGYRRHRRHYDAVVVPGPAPVYAPPAPVYVAPPAPVYVAPPAPVYVAPPAPVYVAPPAPAYTAPPVVYVPAPVVSGPLVHTTPVVVKAPRPVVDNKPNFLALKYMPGFSSNITSFDDVDFSTPTFAHSPGLELRFTRWLSLRSDLEFRQDSRTWDVLGVKTSLFPRSPVKPYASVSFSINEHLKNQGNYSFGFAAAAGLDVFIGKYFFLEAEVRYRMTPGSCCTEVPALTGLVGGGVAFF